ncbi:hypothetical protein ACWEO2_21140 [Nocardia sp. NPDC004278]
MSTNTLVVAGTAFALSIKGSHGPSAIALVAASGALVFVGASVILAARVLISVRGTERLFSEPRDDAASVYAYPTICLRWANFDAFKTSVMDQSPEQQLRGALVELWRASYLHQARRVRLRRAMVCLLISIGFLLVAVGSATITARHG